MECKKMIKKDTIEKINQGFTSVDIKTIDSKNRITIGEKIIKKISQQSRVHQFQVFFGEEGDILLRPLTSIPSREAWIYEKPELIGKIRQGLKEAKQGKVEKIKNLNEFLEEL